MKAKNPRKLSFIRSDQNQTTLLPPSLDELIEAHHMVRFINAIIDKMDVGFLLDAYKGGGRPAYHPRVLLKILVYAYTQGIFTSRQIAKAVRENIHFMWLAGMSRPDFRTINRFRSSRLKGKIEAVFGYVIEQLLAYGYISLNDLFLDGSKFGANANKYKVVWKKNVDRYEKQLQEKIKELLKKIDLENELENRLYGDKDLGEIGDEVELSSDQIEQIVEELNKRLKEDGENKSLKRAKDKLEKDYLPRQRRYEQQREQLKGRSNYSKTDPDATFMRKRADHHGNRELLPSYNVQVGSENRYVTGYLIGQNANDGVLVKPFFEGYEQHYGRLPLRVIADAGYGSEENYEYFEDKGISAYVKYPGYYKKGKQDDPCDIEKMTYDAQLDRYKCRMGRYLEFERIEIKETSTGYKASYRIYRSKSCQGCPLKDRCIKEGEVRRIWVNKKLNAYRAQVKERLSSEEGRELIRRRGTEIETVFGQIKQNFGIRRFLLRGLEKIGIEFGLIAVAYNLKKMYKELLRDGLIGQLLRPSMGLYFSLRNIVKALISNLSLREFRLSQRLKIAV